MDCSPDALIESAKCFRCIPAGALASVSTYLLCQWSNKPKGCQHPTVDAWVARVGVNGGTTSGLEVGGTIYSALCDFMTGMDSASITSKMIAVNCFVPGATSPATTAGELIRACTPLIVGSGTDPWGNYLNHFLPADLSIDGLKGGTDPQAKALTTGLIPSAVFTSANDGGLSLYSTFADNGTTWDCAAFDGAVGDAILLTGFSGTSYYDAYNNGTGRISGPCLVNSLGFTSGNRIAANDQKLYKASGSVPFTNFASGAGAPGSRPGSQIPLFAQISSVGGNPNSFSPKRFSFFAVHHGLTSAECQTFFNLVHAMRIALGGGFIP